MADDDDDDDFYDDDGMAWQARCINRCTLIRKEENTNRTKLKIFKN